MKKILIAFILLFSISSYAQIYMAKECQISFFSETPMENIDATNKSSKPILNTNTNDIQIKISNSGFVFPKPLMQEHFNEEYMESEKFPNTIFKGKINEKIDFSKDGEYKVTVTGKMDMHGVVKETTLNGNIIIKGNQLIISSKFTIHIADYDIKVPSLYVKNIAEDVIVKIDATLEPFKK